MHFGWKPLILWSPHLYDIYKLFLGKGCPSGQWICLLLRVPNCLLLILWTVLRSHRGLLVPTNKVNDILGN